MGDIIFTLLSLAHVHLFMGDTVYAEKFSLNQERNYKTFFSIYLSWSSTHLAHHSSSFFKLPINKLIECAVIPLGIVYKEFELLKNNRYI